MKLTTKIIKQIIGNDGKIFSVTFTKKNGEVRKFNARLGVNSYLKGGRKLYTPEDFNMFTVFSMDDEGYRTVNVDTILRIRANNLVIDFT